MKTLKELKQYYDAALFSELHRLEQQRQNILRKRYALIAISWMVVACILVGAYFLRQHFNDHPGWEDVEGIFFGITCGCCAVVGLVYGFTWEDMKKSYTKAFKTKIIANIIHFMDETLHYEMEKSIPEETFQESQIFVTEANKYRGDDLVTGQSGDTTLAFSEIYAARVTSDGKHKTTWLIFYGLFFVADFHKSTAGATIVLPDKAEKWLGRPGTTLQKWRGKHAHNKQLIALEDPEFEKEFVVYGDDQIASRYILSTSLMKRIVDFQRRTKRPVYLSFRHSTLYVGIAYRRPLFEPKLKKNTVDFALIQEYFEDLRLALSIIDDLNVNTRIWGK